MLPTQKPHGIVQSDQHLQSCLYCSKWKIWKSRLGTNSFCIYSIFSTTIFAVCMPAPDEPQKQRYYANIYHMDFAFLRDLSLTVMSTPSIGRWVILTRPFSDCSQCMSSSSAFSPSLLQTLDFTLPT